MKKYAIHDLPKDTVKSIYNRWCKAENENGTDPEMINKDVFLEQCFFDNIHFDKHGNEIIE